MECVLLARLLKATRYASHMHECKASMRDKSAGKCADVLYYLNATGSVNESFGDFARVQEEMSSSFGDLQELPGCMYLNWKGENILPDPIEPAVHCPTLHEVHMKPTVKISKMTICMKHTPRIKVAHTPLR